MSSYGRISRASRSRSGSCSDLQLRQSAKGQGAAGQSVAVLAAPARPNLKDALPGRIDGEQPQPRRVAWQHCSGVFWQWFRWPLWECMVMVWPGNTTIMCDTVAVLIVRAGLTSERDLVILGWGSRAGRGGTGLTAAGPVLVAGVPRVVVAAALIAACGRCKIYLYADVFVFVYESS